MLKVKFEEKEIEFTDDQRKYGLIRKEFREHGIYLRNKLATEYNNIKNIGAIISKFPQYVEKQQNIVFDICLKTMREYGVVISISEFVGKYYEIMQYYHYIEKIVEEYSDINGEKDQLRELRIAQQNARGKWQGGGFGISGAIKGAMVAGALNWGNDLLHSIGDSSKKNSDNKYIEKRLNDLYKDPKTKYIFVEGAYECIMSVADALYYEMEAQGIFEINTYDRIRASKCSKRAEDNENALEMIEAIKLNPYSIDYYKEFIELVGLEIKNWCVVNNKETLETEDFIEHYQTEYKKLIRKVAEFCYVTEICDWIDNEYVNDLMAKEIRKTKAFKQLDKSDVTKNGYWDILNEYRNITLLFNRGIPISNYYYQKIKEYLNTAEERWPDLVKDPKRFCYFDVTPDGKIPELGIKDFVVNIGEMFEMFNLSSYVKDTYVIEVSPIFKAKEMQIKQRFNYKNFGKLLAIHDSSATGNMRNGVALYELAFVDLKDGKAYMLSEIEEVDNSKHEKVSIYCSDGRNAVFHVNYIIQDYIETIVKMYGPYRGRYERKLKKEEELKGLQEKEIKELSQKSKTECLQEAYEFLLKYNYDEAYKRFSAIIEGNDEEDDDNTLLSFIGNATFFLEGSFFNLKEIEKFVRCIKNGLVKIENASAYYRENIGKFLDFRNENGRGILQALTDIDFEKEEYVKYLESLIQYDFDYDKLYENKMTILDIIEEKRISDMGNLNEKYKGLYAELIRKGAGRVWNVGLGIPYKEYENVYDYIVDFFHSREFKQSSRLYIGNDLKKQNPEKYKQAIEGLGVPNGEHICFVDDKSFGKRCIWGIAISDSGIYYVTEDKKRYHIFWSEINSFEYMYNSEENKMYFNGHSFLEFEEELGNALGLLWRRLCILYEDAPLLFDNVDCEKYNEERNRIEFLENKAIQNSRLKKNSIYCLIATFVLSYFFFKCGLIVKIICVIIIASIWINWKDEAMAVLNDNANVQPKATGKICPRCGKNVDVTEKFCDNCGQKLEK